MNHQKIFMVNNLKVQKLKTWQKPPKSDKYEYNFMKQKHLTKIQKMASKSGIINKTLSYILIW